MYDIISENYILHFLIQLCTSRCFLIVIILSTNFSIQYCQKKLFDIISFDAGTIISKIGRFYVHPQIYLPTSLQVLIVQNFCHLILSIDSASLCLPRSILFCIYFREHHKKKITVALLPGELCWQTNKANRNIVKTQ